MTGPRLPHLFDPSARLVLASGREIRLERLLRQRTFGQDAPFLFSPTRSAAEIMRGTPIAHAQKAFGVPPDGPPDPIFCPPELIRIPGWDHPRHEGLLPAWVSVGVFESWKPTHARPEADASRLAVAWYQNDLNPIFSEAFLAWIRHLDWDAHAQDFTH